jgi:hypothetical protein
MKSHQRQYVTLTDPQAVFLKEEAARLGISVSDLIRRIVDAYRENLPARKKSHENYKI